MELMKGRPEDEFGRLEREIKVYDLPEEKGCIHSERSNTCLQEL